ncbi:MULTISPECIES: SDR family oxidoreductase [Marinobacter]|jgi:UDP-glucose 4-epimerase|uniref:UDP-glucose 4-epimerase n=2 Tax=Marinobacter TaxID=2742 RepID=A0A455WB03_MARNT|nr:MULTISPECIES: SDR family oxidoreductase [Marinobacter]KXO11785.1 UDP-glucose 4-epimerase [Marinobacter excellens LAMA 842]MCD1630076.1 SDR family oxidoreductase [Marinobacter shengliensis]BBJ03875.1 UDP-glucose 4-epimerase [Marinobacter nauticus]
MTTKRRPHILVTGAAGALAQQVISRLRETCDLVAVDFREQVYLGDDIPSYCIDFNKRVFEDLFRRYQFDGVIHLGRILSSQLTRMRRYNANVLGTQKLLDLSQKYGIRRVIVLSTYHVYGAVAYNPALIDESAPLKSAGLSADLVDSVELENLANIYLWRYPELNITILRPCNIVGPGVRNSMSSLLGSSRAPVLAGFSPMMQFIHIDDMADAIVLAWNKPVKGVFNVAPQDWVAYQQALKLCGCQRIPLPSIPPVVPKAISRILNLRSFPTYLMAFFKYPVVIDGRAFAREFGFTPKRQLTDIFRYYQDNKRPV